MFIRRKRSAITLVLAVFLSLPPVTLAQEATAAINDWAGLRTVVGAITGFVIGKTSHKRVLIYQAKQP